MALWKIFLPLFFITFVSSQQVTDEKPFLRIVAPKYLCDDPSKSNGTENDSSNKLTVGLQTREGQRLKYQISIDFRLLDGFKNQRHTLTIWKNVRELQKKFAAQNISDEISLRNQIEIDAMEVSNYLEIAMLMINFN